MQSLICNILWILGPAIIVNTLGWRLWQVRLPHTRAGGETSKYGLDAGIFFFCLGILLSTSQLGVRILFLLMVISIIMVTILDMTSTTKEPR